MAKSVLRQEADHPRRSCDAAVCDQTSRLSVCCNKLGLIPVLRARRPALASPFFAMGTRRFLGYACRQHLELRGPDSGDSAQGVARTHLK